MRTLFTLFLALAVFPCFSIRVKRDRLLTEQLDSIDHSGSQGGFRGHLIMIPENDMTIIWLTNGEQELTETIRSILYRLKYIQ